MFVWLIWILFGQAQVDALCGVDSFEPNNERARAKSTRNKDVKARTCKGDDDWFYLRLKKDEDVHLSLQLDTKKVCAAPIVYPPRARKSLGASYRDKEKSGVRFKAPETGKYRVFIRCEVEPSDYQLKMIKGRAAP
ncbi:hypothetical protein KKF91_05805 [Myxococcota bacterium]|nr:hypothetical protein [Myxococcota bacterium]MBU1430065.1 hypothetical protein [Myxococcota bacterium]MBU1896294.1 hypothetical protein [Myxococcota bacterium]